MRTKGLKSHTARSYGTRNGTEAVPYRGTYPLAKERYFRNNGVVEYLDLTLPTLAENLALDEALLEEADQGLRCDETLRLWESPDLAVIVGRSSRLDVEVDRLACRRLGAPVFRRVSGGAAVVIGPGCLMYAVVLDLAHPLRQPLRSVDQVHRYVLGKLAAAVQSLLPMTTAQGICDLTLGEHKFSGNSLRMKRQWVLYHGTLLYNFPLERIGQLLRMPPRTPDYRRGRKHGEFVANLPVGRMELTQALRKAWKAETVRKEWPASESARLARERYAQASWNEQF
jgi:lipoate-protein ligase A